MKKQYAYILGSILLVAGLLFGVKLFRDEYLPIPVDPSAEWEPFVSTLDVQREYFFVNSDGTKLEAELFIPNGGREKKPAIVFSVGSGDSLYQNYSKGLIETYILDLFLSRDMAVLLMNKRGKGLSEGDYTRNSIEGRAEDIHAAATQIMSHPQIDESKIGLVGHSQGGWVVTRAAAEHSDIAFFISLVGPTTTVEENAVDNALNYGRCQGFEEEELAAYLEKRAKQRAMSVRIGELTNFGMFGFDSRVMGYDPRDALKKIESPGLFVYAENDALVTPSLSTERLHEIFDGNVPKNFSVAVVDATTHGFRLVDDVCESFEGFETYVLSEELTEVLDTWLIEIGY